MINGHGDVALVPWAATYFCLFPLPIYHKQQKLLPYGNPKGTDLLTVLSGWEPFVSPCYDGQVLIVDGCQPSAMDSGIIHRTNPRKQ